MNVSYVSGNGHVDRSRSGSAVAWGMYSRVVGVGVAVASILEDEVPELAVAHRAVDAAHVVIAVDDRDLADDRPDARVDGGEDQDVAAGVGDAPGTEPLGVDVVT